MKRNTFSILMIATLLSSFYCMDALSQLDQPILLDGSRDEIFHFKPFENAWEYEGQNIRAILNTRAENINTLVSTEVERIIRASSIFSNSSEDEAFKNYIMEQSMRVLSFSKSYDINSFGSANHYSSYPSELKEYFRKGVVSRENRIADMQREPEELRSTKLVEIGSRLDSLEAARAEAINSDNQLALNTVNLEIRNVSTELSDVSTEIADMESNILSEQADLAVARKRSEFIVSLKDELSGNEELMRILSSAQIEREGLTQADLRGANLIGADLYALRRVWKKDALWDDTTTFPTFWNDRHNVAENNYKSIMVKREGPYTGLAWWTHLLSPDPDYSAYYPPLELDVAPDSDSTGEVGATTIASRIPAVDPDSVRTVGLNGGDEQEPLLSAAETNANAIAGK